MSNEEMEQDMETNAAEQAAETTSPEPSTNAVATTKPKSQLVAVDTGVLPILPRNVPEATQYANGLIAANIVPDAFKYSEKEAEALGDRTLKGKPNTALIVMGVLKCLEIGVPPQTGLAGLLPINGRFSIWGDLAVAKAQQAGVIANQTRVETGPAFDKNLPLGEWPVDFGVEVRIWRKGQEQPYVGRFTIRDAKRANLWMNQYKKPWVLYPERMLYNRARAFALRDGFADCLNGLSIAEEMLDTLPTVDAEPVDGSSNMDALADDTDNNRTGPKKTNEGS